MPDKNDEVARGMRSLLKYPAVYLAFQFIMNSHAKYRMYLDRFLNPVHGKRILDIGCGCADILALLPLDVEYVGYDLSPEYIAYARKRFGHRAVFHNERVHDIRIQEQRTFDIVLADGLLHHIDDNEAAALFKLGYDVLCPTGFMFTVDPTLIDRQGLISRSIGLMDRGNHVRSPEGYRDIARQIFPRVEIHVISNVSNRVQTACFVKCYKETPLQNSHK